MSKILQHSFEIRKDYEREFIKVDSIKLSYANGGGRSWKRTEWNTVTLHTLRTDLELSNRGVIVMERPQFIGSAEEDGRRRTNDSNRGIRGGKDTGVERNPEKRENYAGGKRTPLQEMGQRAIHYDM